MLELKLFDHGRLAVALHYTEFQAFFLPSLNFNDTTCVIPHRMDAPVSTPLAFRGPWFKKQTKLQKSKAIASPTQDRALNLAQTACGPIFNLSIKCTRKGGGVGWGTPEHFMCLIFSTPSNVVSTPTKRWLATALLEGTIQLLRQCGTVQRESRDKNRLQVIPF